MGRKAAVLVALCAVAGIVAFVLSRGDVGRRAEIEGPERGEVTHAAPRTELEEGALLETEARREAASAELPDAQPHSEVDADPEAISASLGGVSGRVIDAHGVGFADAEVIVAGMGALNFRPRLARPVDPIAKARSAADGRFELTGLVPGEVRVWAGAEEMLWAYVDGVVVCADEVKSDLLLRLEPLGDERLIELVVLDADGAPVPDAKVQYAYRRSGTSGSGSGNTDQNGRYKHLLAAPAPHDFVATDPALMHRPAVAHQVPPGTRDLVMQLGAARDLTVIVTDPSGDAVETFRLNTYLIADSRLLSGQTLPSQDASGRVSMQLPPEPFQLTVDAEGFEIASLELHPDELGEDLAVVLQPLAGIHGRVVDTAGKPVPGADVGLHEVIGDKDWLTVNGFPCRSHKQRSAQATTDDDGLFTMTLRQSGSFYLRASAKGYASSETGPLELSHTTEVQNLEIALGTGGVLRGRVITAAGESSAGLIVGISRADGFGSTQRTDAKGRYRFESLTPGRWLVQRRKDEISSSSTTSSSGSSSEEPEEIPWNTEVWEARTTEYDLDLTTAARVVLAGSLLFSGEPPAGLEAVLKRSDGARVATGRLDSQGDFKLELEEPGTYDLFLRGTWRNSPFLFLWSAVELFIGENEWSENIPVGGIEGVALATSDEPARIRFEWSRAGDLQWSCSVDAQPDGSFSLPVVPAGKGKIQRESTSRSRDIEVTEGRTERVDL